MAGILYIVATPIGNLDDMPPRVAATFGAADFVAAEDTRVTMRLLNYLGLKKPMGKNHKPTPKSWYRPLMKYQKLIIFAAQKDEDF